MTSLAFSSFGLYNILTRLGQIAEIPALEQFIQSLPF